MCPLSQCLLHQIDHVKVDGLRLRVVCAPRLVSGQSQPHHECPRLTRIAKSEETANLCSDELAKRLANFTARTEKCPWCQVGRRQKTSRGVAAVAGAEREGGVDGSSGGGGEWYLDLSC